jgi:hypothetical protein
MNHYTCPACKKDFKPVQGGLTMRCLAKHPAGTCCHYGEREIVVSEEPKKLIDIIGMKQGLAIANYTDMLMEHMNHVLEDNVVDNCDICQNPEKYVTQTHICSCGDEHPYG